MTSMITVFKGSDTNKNLLNELGNNEYALKNKIYFKINQKLWCNGEIMKEWNKMRCNYFSFFLRISFYVNKISSIWFIYNFSTIIKVDPNISIR